jgi:hypothetical protein
MMPDDEIFAVVIELPASERAAHLERVCSSDLAQKARIEALLRGFEASDRFLETPAIERPRGAAEKRPGDLIGRYRLIRRIGSGGCAVWWP